MKKIILIALAGILFGGCYTQIGTIKEDEGYSTSQSEKEYRDYSNYNYDYNYDAWYYSRYIYRYYLPYPRYSLFFRYYTPGFAIGWGECWYYDPYWFDYYWWDWYWWDRYYWYSYWYLPTWYYYPWWYRAPIIVVVNNYPYYSGGTGGAVILKTRNFGSTRNGTRDERSGTTSESITPPSRNAPSGQSSGSLQGSSNGEGFKKRSGSGREAPSIERGRGDERTRETGSVRTPSTPRVVPRSGDGNSETPRQGSTPPQRTDQPRRTGTNRNSIQIYRDYNTGRSTLIEPPHRNFQRENTLSNQPPQPQLRQNSNFIQSDQSQEHRRHLGNRR